MTDAPAATPAEAARAAVLARLDAAKAAASVAEEDFRRDAAARADALAAARAYAFRRADLMEALCAGVAAAPDAELAAASGRALLRARLGWDEDSPARAEVLDRFAPVAVALFEAQAPDTPEAELAAFEAWYASTRQSPFWYLFEHYMPDTPRTDF